MDLRTIPAHGSVDEKITHETGLTYVEDLLSRRSVLRNPSEVVRSVSLSNMKRRSPLLHSPLLSRDRCSLCALCLALSFDTAVRLHNLVWFSGRSTST